MSEEGRKKISFGFSKKSSLQPAGISKAVNDKEFIESVEGQQIKTISKKNEVKKDLVIPLKPSIPKWQRKLLKEKEGKDECVEVKQETLEDLAAQEIINDAKTAMQEKERESNVHFIPIADVEEEEDKDEPTLDDYTKVPVSDFGLAMLRGMGWSPGKGIGKNPKVVTAKEPVIRPRGMGLGAEVKGPPINLRGQEELRLCKGAYVKIFQGALTGCYAQVEGFDDSCGRVIVKLALGGKTQNICEYMIHVVSAKEYQEKASKITIENAEIVKRSTDAANDEKQIAGKTYGLLKKHRSRSPINKKL